MKSKATISASFSGANIIKCIIHWGCLTQTPDCTLVIVHREANGPTVTQRKEMGETPIDFWFCQTLRFSQVYLSFPLLISLLIIIYGNPQCREAISWIVVLRLYVHWKWLLCVKWYALLKWTCASIHCVNLTALTNEYCPCQLSMLNAKELT